MTRFTIIFKYLFDKVVSLIALVILLPLFFVSLIALVILLPLFLVVAVLIKIDSNGPVFFMQERVGKREKVLNLLV